MNKKNEDTKDNSLSIYTVDPEAGNEIVIAIRILKETSGINKQDYIDKTIEKTGRIAQATSKDIFEYSLLSDLKSSDNLTKPLKFFGKIKKIVDQHPFSFEGDSVKYNAIDIEIIDLNGNTINSIPIVSEKKKKKLQKLSKNDSDYCFYGTILYGLKDRDSSKSKDRDNIEYKFFIIDVDPADDSFATKDLSTQMKIRDLIEDKEMLTEFNIATRVLLETSELHEDRDFEKTWVKLGRVGLRIPKERFEFKESLSRILKEDTILEPVKFYGSIYSISNPYRPGFKVDIIIRFDAIDLTLVDKQETSVITVPIVTEKKREEIYKLAKQYSLFCFYGMASYGLKKRRRTSKTEIPIDDLEYRFILKEIEPAENLLEIGNFSSAEITKAKRLIRRLEKNNNGILNYIHSEAVKGLGIKMVKHASLFKASLEFLVLQSFSDHTIGTRSAKLHSLLIGPPAVGKGKLAEVVQVLNYIYNSASGIRWSTAGLIAKSQSGGGLSTSDPGLIPLSHRGVFVMQDFHEAKNKRDLFGMFLQVMEDGIVSDSMVSRTTHRALTSIHLDMNKLTDVYLDDSKKFTKSRYKELKKIGVPLNILSRFDFIVDIKRDIVNAKKTGRELTGQGSSSGELISDLVKQPWARELQALVAILRTNFPKIAIPNKVADYMKEKYDELTNALDSNIEYISDYLLRLSKSFNKIVIATSRANARKEATTDDVDYAFRFLKLKLEFLIAVQPEGVESDAQSSTAIPIERLISIRFEGETISLSQAKDYVNSQIETPLGNRQIRRYLDDNFKKAGRGKWKITKLTS